MTVSNKVHLVVKPSLNWWYQFRKWKYNVQLSGDSRMWWLWLSQYAKRLGKDNFMKDFTEILDAIDKDNKELTSHGEHPIAIFSLYISE